MTHRILPARWGQQVVDLDNGGFSFRVGLSRFPDGGPAEVLIEDVAALISLLLQNGVDLSTIERALDHKADAGLAACVVRLIGGEA